MIKRLRLEGRFSGLLEGAVVLIGVSLFNLCNYLFQFYMSRILAPADYGVLNSLLSTVLVISMPLGVAQIVLANYASRLTALGGAKSLQGVVNLVVSRMLVVSLSIAALFLLSSPLLASFLQIPSLSPLVVTATVLVPVLMVPALRGVLQGLKSFLALSATFVVAGLGRLLGGIALVSWGGGATGALGASAVGALLAVAVALIIIRHSLKGPGDTATVDWRDFLRYGALAFWGTLSFAILNNSDLLAVKHFFGPMEAGYYSAASVLGKTVIYVSGAVVLVIFPKVSELDAFRRDASVLARRGLLAVTLLSGLLLLIFLFRPQVAVGLFFGLAYGSASELLSPYALAMALHALINLLLYYYLAMGDAKFVGLLFLFGLLQWLFFLLFHSHLHDVIYVIIATALALLVASEVVCTGIRGRRRP